MSKGWKAFLIFAAMIALPILADNLLNSRPDIRLFVSLEWSAVWLLLLIFLVGAFPVGWNAFWKFKEDIEGIQGNLKLAERELTKFLADNWDQAGRQAKVKERAEWASMAHPIIVHTLKGEELAKLAEDPAKWSPLAQPSIKQVYNEGFRTVAHEAFDLNKADMAGRGTAMGKVSMTAILLRELYQGSPGRALKKISHEFKAGNTPFIPPGIRELLAFDKFDMEKQEFPKDHGAVGWIMLTLAVEHGKFPRELILMDKGTAFRGWEVIKKLTEPLPPEGWDIPEKPASISMLRLWWKWLTWWE
jgi:hypothetical protein